MTKTRTLTVSDLLATLPKSARVLGFKFHRQDGLLSGKVPRPADTGNSDTGIIMQSIFAGSSASGW